MGATSKGELATALVREGWSHLQCQRPLAAWGSWQRAIRVDPDSVAAAQALATLDKAVDLPLAARRRYRFRQPADPGRRAAWNDWLRGTDGDDLAAMAKAFAGLAEQETPDSRALYNRALCVAWSGENLDAIAALDQAVGLDAVSNFDLAVEAWTLAEVLRQGGGAEMLADDLRFSCTIAWSSSETPWLLEEFPEITHIPTPREPGSSPEETPEIEVYEWYDRPVGPVDEIPKTAADLPVVLASVYINDQALRLSSPRLHSLQLIEEILHPRLEARERSIRREASPLPFAFLDADIWTFRIPSAVESFQADELRRAAIESYFENEWIHHPRQALGALTPLLAARQARSGDPVALAKLMAVVQLREQLGARPAARLLYQGYPFDRLRHRLGLEPENAAMIDIDDLSCASPELLDRIDPETLDDSRLVDAIASAAGLKDDARTVRLSAAYLGRQHPAVPRLQLTELVAPVVRQAIARHDPDGAVRCIERAKLLAADATSKTLDIWRAEILARTNRPEPALAIYRDLITPNAAGAALALDAAETMLDNDHDLQAAVLLNAARELAHHLGRTWIDRRVSQLSERLK